MSPVNKVICGKKSLVPDCNTLAYRKGKKVISSFFAEFALVIIER